ncbi:MAG: hypothetical protein II595_10205, partial [Desulfovibrio sp.]|nr:hypothetical protein [Desulfovibrio sp.]
MAVFNPEDLIHDLMNAAAGRIIGPDKKMISEVVGNSEAVINTSDLSLFRRLMKYVSVTSS